MKHRGFSLYQTRVAPDKPFSEEAFGCAGWAGYNLQGELYASRFRRVKPLER